MTTYNIDLPSLGTKYDTRIGSTAYNALSGISDSGATKRMDLYICHPRPDSETNSWEQHRIAAEGKAYSTPICVEGGAGPLFFVATKGPISVGAWLTQNGDVMEPGDNYGRAYLTNPTATSMPVGGWECSVRVIDMEFNVTSVDWTLDVGDHFVWFDENDTGSSNLGTEAEPYNSWTSLIGTLSTADANAGKAIYFLAGTHNLTGFTDTSDNVNFGGGGTKPYVWMADPDNATQATIDCSGAIFVQIQEGSYFGNGLKFENNRSDIVGHFFYCSNLNMRLTFDLIEFGDFTIGTSVGNNPSCIYVSAAGTRDYVCLSRITKTGNTVSVFQSYQCRHCVVEHVDLSGATINDYDSSCSHGVIYLKQEPENFTIQFCDWVGITNTTSGTSYTYPSVGLGTTFDIVNVHMRFCRFAVTTDTDSIVDWWNGLATNTGPVWIDRCTFVGVYDYLDRSVTITIQDSIWINEESPVIPSLTNQTLTNNLTGNAANGYLDSNGDLTGAAKTSHFGDKGFQIAA